MFLIHSTYLNELDFVGEAGMPDNLREREEGERQEGRQSARGGVGSVVTGGRRFGTRQNARLAAVGVAAAESQAAIVHNFGSRRDTLKASRPTAGETNSYFNSGTCGYINSKQAIPGSTLSSIK